MSILVGFFMLSMLGCIGVNAELPGCLCSIHSPRKMQINRDTPFIPFAMSECKGCSCKEQQSTCDKICFEDLSLRRPSSTEGYWQNAACGQENRLITAPGESCWVGSKLVDIPQCPQEIVYQEMKSKPICCRLSYSRYIFDGTCRWR